MKYCPVYALLRHQTATGQRGAGVSLAIYVAILHLRDKHYADIQEPGAGECNLVALGASAFRRHRSDRRKRHRGLGPSLSSPPPSLPPPPRRLRRLLAR